MAGRVAAVVEKFRNTQEEGIRELVVAEVPPLQPARDEVVVEVKAATLNFQDLLHLTGSYQVKPNPPFTPGVEIAGVIAAVGEGVRSHKVGDRVEGRCWIEAYEAFAPKGTNPQEEGFFPGCGGLASLAL